MCFICISDTSPTITDWLTAAAALIGIPLSLTAFIKLVKKDKEREAQIGKLARIAEVLEGQTEALLSQNELIAQQVDIFRNTSVLKDNNIEGISELRAIEEKRLKLSVRPQIRIGESGYKGYSGEFDIRLFNKGETAYLDEILRVEGDIELYSLSTPSTLEKGGSIYIYGRSNGNKHIKDTSYKLEVFYHDALHNRYHMAIERIDGGPKIVADNEA